MHRRATVVDRFESGDRLTDEERAGDESDGEDDGRLREGNLDAERAERRAEEAKPAEGGQQADPGNGRRQNERQLDQRDRKRAAWKPPRGEEIRSWRTEEEDRRLRDQGGLHADDQRVRDDPVTQLIDERPERDSREDRDQGQQQEGRRDQRREEQAERKERLRRQDLRADLAAGVARDGLLRRLRTRQRGASPDLPCRAPC